MWLCTLAAMVAVPRASPCRRPQTTRRSPQRSVRCCAACRIWSAPWRASTRATARCASSSPPSTPLRGSPTASPPSMKAGGRAPRAAAPGAPRWPSRAVAPLGIMDDVGFLPSMDSATCCAVACSTPLMAMARRCQTVPRGRRRSSRTWARCWNAPRSRRACPGGARRRRLGDAALGPEFPPRVAVYARGRFGEDGWHTQHGAARAQQHRARAATAHATLTSSDSA